MSQKQENDECPMWTCKCGKEILKSATGAISTHINSAECAKNLRAKQKKEKDKNTQPSIETFFNNKKQPIKLAPKDATTELNNVKATTDNNTNSKSHQESNHKLNQESKQESKQENDIYLDHRIVVIDENNIVVDVEDAGKVQVFFCEGIIPDILREEMLKRDDANGFIDAYLPWQKVKDKKRNWWISGNAFHHIGCRGIVIDPLNEMQCNAKCHSLLVNKNLYTLLKESFHLYDSQHNTKLNLHTAIDKLEQNRVEIVKLRSKVQARERRIQNQIVQITIIKRITTNVVLCGGSQTSKILQQYSSGKKSANWCLNKLVLFIDGKYKSKNYDHDDFIKATMCFILGGGGCFDYMHGMGMVMAKSTVKSKIKEYFKGSDGIIFDIEGLNEFNVTKRFKDILEIQGMTLIEDSNDMDMDIDGRDTKYTIQDGPIVVTIKMDEMYHAKKVEVYWDSELNKNVLIGIGAEEFDSTEHIKYLQNKSDCDLVINQLTGDDDRLTLSQLCNVVHITLQTPDAKPHNTYILSATFHSGLSAPAYHAKSIKSLSTITETFTGVVGLTLSSDNASAARKSQRSNMKESNEHIECGNQMPCVPTRTGYNKMIFTLDERHGIKSTFGCINRKGSKIYKHTITMDFIKRCGNKLRIWQDVDIMSEFSEFNYLFVCYGKDQMNVPNVLKFNKCCLEMIKSKNTELLKQLLSENDSKKINKFVVYVKIDAPYVSTLFDREASWQDILFRFATSAFAMQFFFNRNGNKFETSENFYAKQQTAKGIFQLVCSLLKDESVTMHINEFRLYLLHIQSQSLENLFGRVRVTHNGPITALVLKDLLKKQDIIQCCLNECPQYEIKNQRLHGLERINENTVKSPFLNDCNPANAYKSALSYVKKIIKENIPELYDECIHFFSLKLSWLKTEKHDYEVSRNYNDESEDEKANADVDIDIEFDLNCNADKYRVEIAKAKRDIYNEIGMHFRHDLGLRNIATSSFEKDNKQSIIQTSTGPIGMQKYLNTHVNYPLNHGYKAQQISKDRLRGVAGYLSKKKGNTVITSNVSNSDSQCDELNHLFVESDFVLIVANESNTKHHFIGFPVRAYRKGTNDTYNTLDVNEMNRDDICIDMLPVKIKTIKTHKQWFKIDEKDFQKVYSETKNKNYQYMISDFPITNAVRIQHEINDNDVLLVNKRMIECAISSLKKCGATQMNNLNVITYDIDPLLIDDDDTKQIQMINKKKEKKRTKNKTTRKTNNKQLNDKSDDNKIIIVSNTTIPCLLCEDNRYILAQDLLLHNSYHFIRFDTETNQYEITLPTPTKKYEFPGDKTVVIVDIPLNERKQIEPDTCCICLSGNCERGYDKKNKFATSDCQLFTRFGLKQARKISDSIPTTNIMLPCDQNECDKSIYKYLHNAHYEALHPTSILSDNAKVTQTEMKKAYNVFQKWKKGKTRKPKHGPGYELLIPYTKLKEEFSAKQQKSSNKYSIKSHANPKRKRNDNNDNAIVENQIDENEIVIVENEIVNVEKEIAELKGNDNENSLNDGKKAGHLVNDLIALVNVQSDAQKGQKRGFSKMISDHSPSKQKIPQALKKLRVKSPVKDSGIKKKKKKKRRKKKKKS
eukprot:80381_1